MKSYIAIHNFIPKKTYPNLNEIEKKIKEAVEIEVETKIKEAIENGIEKKYADEDIDKIKKCVIERMKEYNNLIGVDNATGLNFPMLNPPKGLLPSYTNAILAYFVELDEKNEQEAKEIKILENSGIKEIKIRYKHSYSVIKKLVKIAFKSIDKVKRPMEVFLRGGKLHDLIGIEFVCFYPYQREWVARSLYNFFKIPDRSDYNLTYGFYSLNRESGYKALHCDNSYFKPSFDEKNHKEHHNKRINLSLQPEGLTTEEISNKIETYIKKNNMNDVLAIASKIFNIEIQIHTAFESAWSKMEHEKSYDELAKGKGKDKDVTVLWKMLSDNLSTIESQFEHLQSLTHKSGQATIEKKDFGFIGALLEDKSKEVFEESVNYVKKLREDLNKHEISRRDYVNSIDKHISGIKDLIKKDGYTAIQKQALNLQIAFIYYSYSNHDTHFNEKDMSKLLKDGILIYEEISNNIISQKDIYNKNEILIGINSCIRYCRLAQKHGFGLLDTKLIDIYKNAPRSIEQTTKSEEANKYFQYGLYYMIRLKDEKNTLLNNLQNDSNSYIRTILYLEKLISETTLNEFENIPYFIEDRTYKTLPCLIEEFRNLYINDEFKNIFFKLLHDNKTNDKSFILGTLSILIRNKELKPIDAFEKIIQLASEQKLKAKDLFYFEEASYKNLYENPLKEYDFNKGIPIKIVHYGNYHYENMIYLLFKMKNQNQYEYYKARIYFNTLVDNDPLKEHLKKLGREKVYFSESYFSENYDKYAT